MNKKDEIKYSLYFFYLLSFIYTRFIFYKVLSITTSTVFVFNVHLFFISFKFLRVIIVSYCPLWANLLVFTVKYSVWLYSDRKPRACQKFGVSSGLANALPLGSAKFADTPPTELTRRANARSSRGGGLGAAGIGWCINIAARRRAWHGLFADFAWLTLPRKIRDCLQSNACWK